MPHAGPASDVGALGGSKGGRTGWAPSSPGLMCCTTGHDITSYCCDILKHLLMQRMCLHDPRKLYVIRPALMLEYPGFQHKLGWQDLTPAWPLRTLMMRETSPNEKHYHVAFCNSSDRSLAHAASRASVRYGSAGILRG